MLIPSFVNVERVFSCVRYYRTVTPVYGLTTCPHGQHIGRQMFIIPRPARAVAYTWATILASFLRGCCCGFHVSVANRPETANCVCLITLHLKSIIVKPDNNPFTTFNSSAMP